MKTKQVEELILQSLEHEMGGVNVYAAAIGCVVNAELKKEWQGYLEQTRAHVSSLQNICKALGIDPARTTPGREVVRGLGQSLLDAMNKAKAAGDPAAAE